MKSNELVPHPYISHSLVMSVDPINGDDSDFSQIWVDATSLNDMSPVRTPWYDDGINGQTTDMVFMDQSCFDEPEPTNFSEEIDEDGNVHKHFWTSDDNLSPEEEVEFYKQVELNLKKKSDHIWNILPLI